MAERPAPLSISVCALVALNADSSSPLSRYLMLDREEWEKRLLTFLHGQLLAPHCDDNLGSFMRHLKNAAGTLTAQLLTDCLKRISASIDTLMDFFSSLQLAVSDGTIDETSAQGVYCRKTCLGFDLLSFDGVTRLWELFREQVQKLDDVPSVVGYEEKEQDCDDTLIKTMTNELWPLSPQQMETILRQQCASLEQTDHSYEGTEKEIRRIMSCDPELPAVHFLRFLNCLRHGERVGALHAMHQYFDYAMIKARKDATTSSDRKVEDVAQYAAILLAALHKSFGDDSLSLKATEEAVRVSQESRDPASVAYALGWLYCNEMGMDAQDLLKRCASRASEGHLRPLVAGANFSLARDFLGTDTSNAAACWTSLMDATTDPPPSSTTVSLDRPTHTTNVVSSDDAMALLARQILVGGGIWQAFGLNGMSGLSSLVGMHCYSDHLSPHEAATVICNLARVSLYGRLPETFGLDSDDTLQSLLSNSDDASSSCRYATALRMLMRLHDKQKQSDITYSVALILHEWAVRRGDLAHAEYLTGVLESYLHPRMPNYKTAYVETMIQHVLLLSRQGEWQKAKQLAKELCDMCKAEGRGLRVQHATLLIQLAMIQLESIPHNFIGALPPLFECLNLCKTSAMDSLEVTALVVLAQVHFRMQNTKQAIALLKATLPRLSQHAHVWFVGEAYLTLAKCQLQQARKESGSSNKYKLNRMLQAAVRSLEHGAESFRECQDAVRLREVYYLLARTYNSLSNKTMERNESCKQFAQVSRHLQQAQHSWQRGSLSDMAYLEELASRSLVDSY